MKMRKAETMFVLCVCAERKLVERQSFNVVRLVPSINARLVKAQPFSCLYSNAVTNSDSTACNM